MSAPARVAFFSPLGVRVVVDERMGREQWAIVDERGRGIAVEGSKATPCILPPPPAQQLNGG